MRAERCKEGMGVQTGAEELWQEMLGRRRVEWCWELEERRWEKKAKASNWDGKAATKDKTLEGRRG